MDLKGLVWVQVTEELPVGVWVSTKVSTCIVSVMLKRQHPLSFQDLQDILIYLPRPEGFLSLTLQRNSLHGGRHGKTITCAAAGGRKSLA